MYSFKGLQQFHTPISVYLFIQRKCIQRKLWNIEHAQNGLKHTKRKHSLYYTKIIIMLMFYFYFVSFSKLSYVFNIELKN